MNRHLADLGLGLIATAALLALWFALEGCAAFSDPIPREPVAP